MSAAADHPRAASPGQRDEAAEIARYHAEVARHYRWNLAAHLLYGLFGTTGWRLITAPTFVPDYMFRLGGSNLAVGLLLFAGGLGRFLSPLAGAAFVAHRPLVKRTAVLVGSGMRFQVLGMALAALVLPASANYVAFFVLYCAFSILNGLQSVVYGLLMAKVIPLARRGRFLGLRDFAGGTTAAAVAWLAARLLRDMSFPASYGVTYLVAFAFTSLGLVCFAAIREPRAPFVQAPRSLATTLRSVPPLLARDPPFAWYCVARGLGARARRAHRDDAASDHAGMHGGHEEGRRAEVQGSDGLEGICSPRNRYGTWRTSSGGSRRPSCTSTLKGRSSRR